MITKVKGIGKRENLALTNKQKHALNKWLESNYERIRYMTRVDIAGVCSSEIGFTVSVSSVTTGIDATGLEINARKATSVTGLSPSAIHKLRSRCLLRDYKSLCEELGRPFPAGLQSWLATI